MRTSRRSFIQSASGVALALPCFPKLLAAAWHPPSPIEGEPFSIVTERHFARSNANGTQTDRLLATSRMYRDSDGRVRTEVGEILNNISTLAPNWIAISDPIAVRTYFLDTKTHTAREQVYAGDVNVGLVTMLRQIDQSSALATYNRTRWNSEHPDSKATKLGDDTILGEPVTGRRKTMTFPAGDVDGNEKPIVVTLDTWSSKGLGIALLCKFDDPREGVTTTRATQLDRTEPDPSLFQIPADFTIEK